MKLIHGMLTDLRERQILPAVVLLALLAFAVPIGGAIIFSGVTTPAPAQPAPYSLHLPKGLPAPADELAVLNGTPPQSVTRHGTPADPFSAGSSGSSSGGGGSSSGGGSKPAPTVHTTTTVTVTHTQAVTTTQTRTQVRTTTATHTATTTHTKTKTTSPKTTTTSTTTTATGTGSPLIGPATLKPDQAYTVTLNTKDAQGTHTLSNVVRLAPLPAAQSPEVVFLGVLKGGKKAVFLFANPIKFSGASGETCLPSAADCQIIELAPGQGMKLAPASNTALIATFTFQVASIGARTYSSAGAAANARNATSSSGQTLLPLIGSTELSSFHFDSAIGALVHKASGASTGTNSSSAVIGSAGGATGGAGAITGSLLRRTFVVTPAR